MYMYVYIYIYIYIYMYMYVYIYVYTCIWVQPFAPRWQRAAQGEHSESSHTRHTVWNRAAAAS